MALFQKKILPISTPRYTLGTSETFLVIGLGNIGDEYIGSRHNAGFHCVDDFALREGFSAWVEKKDLKSYLCAKMINGKKIILCKPTTYMNNSGEAIALTQKYYKIPDEHTCIVYDEIDLSLGTIRTGSGGSSAGHNGIKSLIKHTANSSWRIRIGIGPKNPPQIDTADFVLGLFKADEMDLLKLISQETSSIVMDWLSGNKKAETRLVA